MKRRGRKEAAKDRGRRGRKAAKRDNTRAEGQRRRHAGGRPGQAARFEQVYLTSLLGLRQEKYFWIGLSDTEERGNFKWVNEGHLLYTHWNAEMPGRKQGCVAMRTGNKGGLWDVISCDEKAKFVCKKWAEGVTTPPVPTTTKEPTCPAHWATGTSISSCFKYYARENDFKKTWTEARDFCRAIGGDLASISNKEEEQTVNRMFLSIGSYRHYGKFFWIGLVNSDPDEGFQWSDGSPMFYEKWDSDEIGNHNGNQRCGGLIADYWVPWNAINCDTPKDWICKLKKGATLNPEPTIAPDSAYDVNSEGWITKDDTQYFVSEDLMSMHDAQVICKKNFGDLATINGEEENKFLWKYILKHGKPDVSYFIGLSLGLDKAFKWMDGTLVTFVAWSVNEPNFANNDENCVVMNRRQGLWNDINCGYPNSFICERKIGNINTTFAPTAPAPEGGCPSQWLAFGKQCYTIYGKEEKDRLDWDGARSACQQQGGNLASIPNDLVHAYLLYNLKDVKIDVWIGLNDRNKENKFLWTDQRTVSYTNWAKGHPSGNQNFAFEDSTDCVAIQVGSILDTGTWVEVHCDYYKGYICQKSKDPNLPAKPTMASPSNFIKFDDASYKLVTTKMPWDEARRMCKNEDSELTSILDEYTTSFLKVLVAKYHAPVWIGLNSNKTNNQYKWIENRRLRYTKWAPGEPTKKDACVYMNEEGLWKTPYCNVNYASICKKTNVVPPTEPPQLPGVCPESEINPWIPFRGHCYLVESSNTKSWASASVYCMMLGASLVSVDDEVESEFLLQHIEMLYDRARSFWAGLYRNVEGTWLWLDNTPLDYVNWNNGEPSDHLNEHCVEIYSSKGTWNNDVCSAHRGYICKKLKTPLPTVKPVKPEETNEEQQKTSHHVSGGVATLVIVIVAGAAIAVFYLYKRKQNNVPPPVNTFNNTLYFEDNKAPESHDAHVLVENIEQNELANA